MIEADRSAVCPCSKIDEFLEVLSAGRRRRILRKLEDEIEDLSDVLGEIGDVFVERAVIDREETYLVVLKWNELGEVRRADFIQIFRGPTTACAQDKFDRDEMKV